jgi:hypothetical protein
MYTFNGDPTTVKIKIPEIQDFSLDFVSWGLRRVSISCCKAWFLAFSIGLRGVYRLLEAIGGNALSNLLMLRCGTTQV